jgi:hypothetical protein
VQNNAYHRRGAPNVAGASIDATTFHLLYLAKGFKAINVKADRYITGKYKLHYRSLEVLSFLWCWLILLGKLEEGASITAFVQWSGKTSRWKRRFARRIEDCIEMEVIEKIPFGTIGFRVRPTQKGIYILQDWVKRVDYLNATMLQKGI